MPSRRRLWGPGTIAALTVCTAGVVGCASQDAQTPAKSSPPQSEVRPNVALRITVIDDDELAAAVKRLRGEWAARSGGQFEVTSETLDALRDAKMRESDVFVFPSRHLGTLAEHGDLQPIRASVLASAELALSDIYPTIRDGEMKYGGETLALPLGSPPLLRAEGQASTDRNSAALPLDGNAAAFTLLSRALPYVEPSHRADALFNAENMEPQITSAPFVRALSEVVRDAASRRGNPPLGFGAAIELVQTGNASWSIGWPGLTHAVPPQDGNSLQGVAAFVPLPAAADVFVASSGNWQIQGGAAPVTLLGVEGRLLGVSRTTRNAVTALKLCQWLASGGVAVRVSSASRGTAWFRQSQVSQSGAWMNSGAGANSGEVVSKALAVDAPWLTPRLPGIDDYLATLAEQVRKAVAGDATAEDALAAAASEWEAITERRGRQGQVKAYRRHLGIDVTTGR